MTQNRPLRDFIRADKQRQAEEAAAKVAATQKAADDLQAAEAAWPPAMAHLTQAISDANKDLEEEGIEERFFNQSLACDTHVDATQIVLVKNGQNKATAFVYLGRTGDVQVRFKHVVRVKSSTFHVTECSVETWAKVLEQLYKITMPRAASA